MDGESFAPAYVYMVRCGGGRLYTGWTNDPAARLHAHKTGQGARATRAFGALSLAYLEPCADKPAALRREAALKKLSKSQKEALCAEWARQMQPRLSMATCADAADILHIYNWYVRNRIATFQITPSTLEEYQIWVIPHAFTEQGVSMLSAVLRSPTAIQVSISIMDAFVAMRNCILTRTAESVEIARFRERVLELEQATEEILGGVNDLSQDVRKDIETIYEVIGALSVELPTLYFHKIDRLIGTARSNKVSVTLGF